MHLNVLAYIIYLTISIYVTIWVGQDLHNNGLKVIKGVVQDKNYIDFIIPANNSLLIGYYLLNIGAIFLHINLWEEVQSINQLIYSIGIKVASVLLLLGSIHIINLSVLTIIYFKSNTRSSKFK